MNLTTVSRAALAVVSIGAVFGLSACATSTSDTVTSDQASGPKEGLAQVSYDGVPTVLLSPVIRDGVLYVGQSVNQGSIFEWDMDQLPDGPSPTPVAVKPVRSTQPEIPGNVKMEQINFDNSGKNILMGRKAININAPGGNSIWSYPFGGGAPTQIAGNTAPAGNGYYSWGPGGSMVQPSNNAKAANAYTESHFPTTAPKTVSIGDGAGVVQAKNGYTYFSSLQSGCVYKANPDATWADAVYCIPNWGAGNTNASIYSLAEDKSGDVYAVYQGSTDINTIVLKITPKGDKEDTVGAIQVTGYARSVGLAVNGNGKKLWINGVSMEQYSTHNQNTILEINNPKWGTTEKPTPTTSTPTVVPGRPVLVGMALDEREEVLYVVDGNGGFWMLFM